MIKQFLVFDTQFLVSNIKFIVFTHPDQCQKSSPSGSDSLLFAAEFIIFNAKFIVFDTQFLVFNAKFIVFTHRSSIVRTAARRWGLQKFIIFSTKPVILNTKSIILNHKSDTHIE